MSNPEYGEILGFLSEALSENRDRDVELQDFVVSNPKEVEQDIQRSLEINPKDGCRPLAIIDACDIEVHTLEDVNNLLKGMQVVAEYGTKKAGFTVYPVIEMSHLQDKD